MPSLEEVFLKVTEKALGIADGVMSSWNRANDGNGDGGYYSGFAKPSERMEVSSWDIPVRGMRWANGA